ncbi:hypothetical protein [Streptomyces sp. NPDC047070]|uniref:hypothetical protein n=1 Tax=Streptomyces sp. NPDC047070 TaxID=3154923 RepID=UPI003453D59D
MTGTDASLRIIESDFAVQAAIADLQGSASGSWNNTGLLLVLPRAGTYQLDATVRAALSGTSPVNVFMNARLFDATAGAAVPDSEVVISQVNVSGVAGIVQGSNQSASIQVEYTVTEARSIRVQGRRTNILGASTTAQIHFNSDGRTTLRYRRIA